MLWRNTHMQGTVGHAALREQGHHLELQETMNILPV